MTLSKVSFPDILRNEYLDHFDTFEENFDFDTLKNDTFESVCAYIHPHIVPIHLVEISPNGVLYIRQVPFF